MATQFPITFSLSPMPTGQQLDANTYGQLLVSNLQAYISGQFLTGQIGGAPPTTDIGLWFSGGLWYYWDPGTSSYIPQTLTSSFPTGSILDFAGTSAPTGFVMCDGSLYLRTGAMANLFAVIGTLYGAGDGFSTFSVPDLRGRTTIGAGSGPGLSARALASKLGSETQALAVSDLAAHTHGLAHTHTLGNHTHTMGNHTHTMGTHTHTMGNHTHTMGNHTHLGVDHLHSMNGHTHSGVNHLHSFTGVDHIHAIPAGQFNHAHGVSAPNAFSSTVQGLQVGGATYFTPQAQSITAATLPAGGTDHADRSLASITAGSDRDLTTGAPSTPSTGAADRGLTTAGPSTNTSDGPSTNTSGGPSTNTSGGPITNTSDGPSTNTSDGASVANTGSNGSGTAHNNMQPGVALNKIIKV